MVYLILSSLIIGVARFFVPGHNLSIAGSYEAIAHLLVGSLLTIFSCNIFSPKTRVTAFTCLVVITLIEIYMFVRFLNEY